MLLAHYLPKFLTALFGGLFIFAGVYTFGNALLFDRIFIGVLVFAAIVCYRNVNVVGVLIIIVIQRVLEETAWFLLNTEFVISVKLLFYILSAYACFHFKYDPLSKLLFACIALALSTEIYWFIYGGDTRAIHWFVATVTMALYIRHLIFMRVSYTEDYFPKHALSINLDWQIHKLYATASFVHAALLLELVLNEIPAITGITPVTLVFPYIMHAIAIIAVWIVFNESYKLLLPRLLKA